MKIKKILSSRAGKITTIGVVLFIVGTSSLGIYKNFEKNNVAEVKEEVINENFKDDNSNLKHGTTEYYESIVRYVRDNSSDMMHKVNEAWNWTKDNYPNYYTDSNTMEKAIFYGEILDVYGGDKKIKDVGTDLVQAVKYVYRGVETVDSQATKENLIQIEKGIN